LLPVIRDVSPVSILVAARLLKPLGNPQKNGIKFFATSDLLELSKDRVWLVKVTNAVNRHWQMNNASKKGRLGDGVHDGYAVSDGQASAVNS
jgi:hypothetical protein